MEELFWSTLFRILEWAIGLKVAECYNCYWWILDGGEKGLVLLGLTDTEIDNPCLCQDPTLSLSHSSYLNNFYHFHHRNASMPS